MKCTDKLLLYKETLHSADHRPVGIPIKKSNRKQLAVIIIQELRDYYMAHFLINMINGA